MALYPDEQEQAARKRKYDIDKKSHRDKSVKKYGEVIGNAYHHFIYDGDTNSNIFYVTMARLLVVEEGDIKIKALALSAMFDAFEERMKILLEKAARNNNPVY